MKHIVLRQVMLPMAVLAGPAALSAQMTPPDPSSAGMQGLPPEVPGAPAPGEGQPVQPPPGVPSPPHDPAHPQPVPENPTMPPPAETPMPPSPPAQPGMPGSPTMQTPTDPSPMPGQQDQTGAGMSRNGAQMGTSTGGMRWGPRTEVPAPAPQASYPPCSATVQDQCVQTRDDRSARAKKARRR